MNEPIYIVFNIVVYSALWLFYARFIAELAEVEKSHPYMKALCTLTALADVYSKLFVPLAKGRFNTAAMVILFLLWLIGLAGRATLLGESLTALELFFVGSITAIMMLLNVLKWTILLSILMSFVVLFSQRASPFVDVIMQLSEPLIAPFRKISPNLGMLDLSPLLAILTFGMLSSVVGVLSVEVLRYAS